jgi:curli biogenesis system outer membrane secretion channel CsgG
MPLFAWTALATAMVDVSIPTSFAQAQRANDAKPPVAVLGFSNGATGRAHQTLDPLRIGISELLITELAHDTAIRVLERERLAAILAEHRLSSSRLVDQTTAVQVGKVIGVQNMIFGSFVTTPSGRLKIVARRVNVATGEIEQVNTAEGAQDDLFELVTSLGTALARGLHPIVARKPNMKLDLVSVSIYASGLDAMDKHDTATAVRLFEEVLTRFPGFAPAAEKVARLKPR